MGRTIFVGAIIWSFLALPALADLDDYLADGPDVGSSVVDTGQWSGASNGGEFAFYNVNLSNSWYADATKGKYGYADSFQTFCVETDEYVFPPDTVQKTIVNEYLPGQSRAVMGGSGGSSPDPLSNETAYLYTEFALGRLSDYRYTGTDAQRKSDADQLQRAIWALEEEMYNSTTSWASKIATDNGQAKEWYDEAVAEGWTSIGSVRVLNLYSNTQLEARQDMLYLVPVPGAALLAGLGLVVAGRKLRRFV